MRLRDVSKNYGKFQALIKVSLDFRLDEITCITGKNGSGKTTLMKLLTGLEAYEGTIDVNLPAGYKGESLGDYCGFTM